MIVRTLGVLLLIVGLIGCGGGGDPVDAASDSEAVPETTLEVADAASDAASDAETETETETETEPDPDLELDSDSEELPDDGEEIAVRIYFPSKRGDGLISESRTILPSKNAEDRIKQILGHLLKGPSGSRVTVAVPTGTTLRQAYLASNGAAYVDFSAELQRGLNGGSMQETLTVYSIVNSVTLNIRDVRSVGILVAGQPLESLNGHLDLRYPLRSNRDLLLR